MEFRSVLKESQNYKVELSEKIVFAEWQINDFIKIFNVLKEGNYVKAYSFSDITWLLPCPITHKEVKINFAIKHHDLYNPLKAFTILRRRSGKNPATIYGEVERLKDVFSATDGLRSIEKLDAFFTRPHTGQLYRIGLTLINFLNFYPIQGLEKVASSIIERLRKPDDKNRDLPPFEDVLIFNDVVNSFFDEKNIEDTFRYYPILLWWAITNIIPMRPVEFLNLKRSCISKKEDNSLWLTLPRFKMKTNSMDEVHWEQNTLIDVDTYRLIKNYIFELDRRSIFSEYLIPDLVAIHECFEGNNSSKDICDSSQFRLLIKKFYEDVVEGLYEEHGLQTVKPGDTRHFAIINMFLQGFNVLTIARLSGHTQITSPSNYFDHAKHFVSSFIYKLAQKRIEGTLAQKLGDGFIGVRKHKLDRARAGLNNNLVEKNYRRVDYGFCKDESFPSNCVEDCRLCEPFYIFNPSLDEWEAGVKWFEESSGTMQIRINEIIDLMAMLSVGVHHELKALPPTSDQELKSLSVQLFKYLDHKALMDARMMEANYEHYQ